MADLRAEGKEIDRRTWLFHDGITVSIMHQLRSDVVLGLRSRGVCIPRLVTRLRDDVFRTLHRCIYHEMYSSLSVLLNCIPVPKIVATQ